MTTTLPRARNRGAFWMRTLCCLIVATSFIGCSSRNEEQAPRLKIPSDKAALSFVDGFFQAYVRTDLDSLRELLCEKDEAHMFRVLNFIQESQAPMSPFRVDTFQVRSAAPVWIGREPYFRVEVSFPRRRSPGQLLHVYQVNAKAGCVQGFLDVATDGKAVDVPKPPVEVRPPATSPPAPPLPPVAPPPPSETLIPDGVEVIEL